MNRTVFASLTILGLLSVLSITGLIHLAKANGGTIYINADGSITPSTAPIATVDNVTYTFMGNVSESIVIVRDNVVLEGKGYTIQGSGSGKGIDLTSTYNVTIENANIMGFYYGIYLYTSSSNVVLNNNMTENDWAGVELDHSANNIISANNMVANNYGIDLSNSVNNTISENEIEESEGMYAIGIRVAASDDINISRNNIAANDNDGVWLLYSSNNIIIENNITANKEDGVYLDYSTNNIIIGNNITANGVFGTFLNENSSNNVVGGNNITNNSNGIAVTVSSSNSISGNNITSNDYGILVGDSSDNRFYHNNIINNSQQVSIGLSVYANIWDDSYPSGGNYWNDYNGTDSYSGSYQNETSSDEIGDAPYIINANNTDRYPLMRPFDPQTENLLVSIRNLLLEYKSLQTNCSNLQTNFVALNSSYLGLKTDYDALNASYNSLNASFRDYQQTTQDELANVKNTLYVFIAVTAILAVALGYVAIRKPKTKPET